MDEYKATLQELNAIFTWNFTEWFGNVKKEEVVSSNGNIQTVDWDCNPDIKTVELDSCDIDEADAIEDTTKDPNIGILGTIIYPTKAFDDDDGEESKKIIDDATRALNPTEREKKNNCGLCEDISAKNENLKKHLETHMKRADVECSACTKSFDRKDIQRNHVKKHTGEKPVNCRICGEVFSKPDPDDETDYDYDLKAVGMKPSLKEHSTEKQAVEGIYASLETIIEDATDVTLPQGWKLVNPVQAEGVTEQHVENLEDDEESVYSIVIMSFNSEQQAVPQEVVEYWSSRGEESKLENFTENDVFSLFNVISGHFLVQKMNWQRLSLSLRIFSNAMNVESGLIFRIALRDTSNLI